MKKILLAIALSGAFAFSSTAFAAADSASSAASASDVPTQAIYKLPADFASKTLIFFESLSQNNQRASQLKQDYDKTFQTVSSLVQQLSADKDLKKQAAQWSSELKDIQKAMQDAQKRATDLYNAQTKTMTDVPALVLSELKGLPVYLADVAYAQALKLQKILDEIKDYTPKMNQDMQSNFVTGIAQLKQVLTDYPDFYQVLRMVNSALPETAGVVSGNDNESTSVSALYTLIRAVQALKLPEVANAQAVAVLRQYQNAFADSTFKALSLLPQKDGPFVRVYGLYSKTPGNGISVKLTQLMAGTNWLLSPGFSIGVSADTAIQSTLSCSFCNQTSEYNTVTAGVSAFMQMGDAAPGLFAKLYTNWRHYDLSAAETSNIDLMYVRLPGTTAETQKFSTFQNPTPAYAWSGEALVQLGYKWVLSPYVTIRPEFSYQWNALHFKDLPQQTRHLMDGQLALTFSPKPRLQLGVEVGLGRALYRSAQEVDGRYLLISNSKVSAEDQPELLAGQELRYHGALSLHWKANLVSNFSVMLGGDYYNKSKAKALYYQLQYQYQF